MENTCEIQKQEYAAYTAYKTAEEWVEATGRSLLTAIRDHGLSHAKTRERYGDYCDKLHEYRSTSDRWHRLARNLKQKGIQSWR